MSKTVIAIVTSVALASIAGCASDVGKGKGKGKAPAPVVVEEAPPAPVYK
jgi:hypothetical protein